MTESESAEQPVEMGAIQAALDRLSNRLKRFRRHFPFLVWYNDEVDVTVTLCQERLDSDQPFTSFYSGVWRDIQLQMHDAGVSFDSGIGCDGRDWEWDFSLKGPISVRFRGRAERPELRRERPRPKL